MARNAQTKRQWRILMTIASERYATKATLAAKLGYSTKTIHRDITALEEVGFPLYTEPNPEGRGDFIRIEREWLRLRGGAA